MTVTLYTFSTIIPSVNCTSFKTYFECILYDTKLRDLSHTRARTRTHTNQILKFITLKIKEPKTSMIVVNLVRFQSNFTCKPSFTILELVFYLIINIYQLMKEKKKWQFETVFRSSFLHDMLR